MSRELACLLVAFSGLFFAGCGLPTAVSVATSDPDKEAAELLADKGSVAEAKAWLAGDPKRHLLWSGDRDRLRGLVEGLYTAGAQDVSVVALSREGDLEIAALILITLPDDAPSRLKALATYNQFWRDNLADDDPETLAEYTKSDYGQKYLYLSLDD